MKKQLQTIPTTALSASPRETSLTPAADDSAIGQQLTAQYQRAVGGMREVLIFGAMLKQVEKELETSCVHGGHNSASRGPTAKGLGLKGWLATNAPEISRPTALRFLGVTEAIAQEYQAIVGEKIAKCYDLPALVLANADDLDEQTALKQGELFSYVAGTSQRSWLDRYKLEEKSSSPAAKKEKLTPEQKLEADIAQFKKVSQEAVCSLQFLVEDRLYVHLNDVELDRLILAAEESLASLNAWKSTPKRDRTAQVLAQLKR